MSEKKFNIWKIIMALGMLLAFLSFFLTQKKELQVYTYAGEDVPYNYFDEEDAQPITHMVNLKRGSYHVMVDYETESEASCETFMTRSYGQTGGDVVLFVKENNQQDYEIMLYGNADNYYLMSASPDLAISKITFTETRKYYRVLSFIAFLVFFTGFAAVSLKKSGKWDALPGEKKQVLFFIVAIGILSSAPLFTNYLWTGSDDLRFHLMRIEGLSEGIRRGYLPVKMQPLWLNDHGYPVSVMYGDLLLYIPAAIRLIGFPLQTAYKCYVFLINILTAAGSYCVGKTISGSWKKGLVLSFLYTFSVYRIMNLYYRSALGEFTGMALLPFIFLGLWKLFHSQSKKETDRSLLLLLVSYTLLLESHLLSFMMAIVFSVFYCLLNWKAFCKNFLPLVKTAVVTIILNLGFLVPMLDTMAKESMTTIDNDRFNMQEWGLHIPQIFQMFSISTENSGYYTAGQGILDERLMGVGIAFGAVLVLYIWQLVTGYRQVEENLGKEGLGQSKKLFFLTMLCVFMTTYLFPWKWIEGIPGIGSFLAPYQFAWRFTQMALVFGLMLGAYTFKNLDTVVKEGTKTAVLTTICILALITGSFSMEARMQGTTPMYVTGAGGLDTRLAVANGEYLPENTYAVMINRDRPEPEEGCIVTGFAKEKGVMTIWCENPLDRDAYVKVPVIAYRGYHAVSPEYGMEFYISKDYQNVAMVIVPAGYNGTIKVYFKEPKLWRLTEMISIITAILLVIFLWKKKNKKGGL